MWLISCHNIVLSDLKSINFKVLLNETVKKLIYCKNIPLFASNYDRRGGRALKKLFILNSHELYVFPSRGYCGCLSHRKKVLRDVCVRDESNFWWSHENVNRLNLSGEGVGGDGIGFTLHFLYSPHKNPFWFTSDRSAAVAVLFTFVVGI